MDGESGRWSPAGAEVLPGRAAAPSAAGAGPSRCPAVVRRRRIVQLLRRSGYVHAADLTGLLGVSEMTIRRDLDELVREGLGVRVWGGLVAPGLADPGGVGVPDEAAERLDQARRHLLRAEQALDAGRLTEARVHARAVVRHLDDELAARPQAAGTG